VARAGDDSLEDFFKAFPTLLGRAATPVERRAFDRYADLLIHWNRTHHLTSLRTRAAIGRGLFLDSFLFRTLMPAEANRVVDIGAGAGIPGMPLRIVDRKLSLTLIESRRKPVSFLHALVRELELKDVVVHHGRAEGLASELPDLMGKYDLVLTRSVGLTPSFIRSAMPYLKPGGLLLASGPPAGSPQPQPNWPGQCEWKTIRFAKIGLTRTFFVAVREIDFEV
jgi:16S rRNA (guanine527-N7)-methyltransferase